MFSGLKCRYNKVLINRIRCQHFERICLRVEFDWLVKIQIFAIL